MFSFFSVKKSRSKLSKSSSKEIAEQEELSEDQRSSGKDELCTNVTATSTLDEDQCGPRKDNLSSHVAETITLDADESGPGENNLSNPVTTSTTLDTLITIEDSGIGHGDTITEDVIRVDKSHSTTTADVIRVDKSHNTTTADVIRVDKFHNTTTADMIRVDKSHDTTTADVIRVDKSHNTTTADVIRVDKSHNTTTVDVIRVDKSHDMITVDVIRVDKSHDMITEDVIRVDKSHKLQKSSTFRSIRDSDDVDSSLSTRYKTKRLDRSKAGRDMTEVEVQLVDEERGRDRTQDKMLSSKQQRLRLGGRLNERDSGQSDSEPAVHLKGGRKDQRKLRLKRTTKTARPFTMPSSPDTSSCDSSSSAVWKVPLLSVAQQSTSFEKRGAKKTIQLEKFHRSAGSGSPNSSGDAVLPISQVAVSYSAKNSLTGNRNNSATASSDSLMGTKASKRKKTFEKTSSKLATILKEMDDDILGNAVYTDCRVAPSRARTVVPSDISLITRRDSLDFDPFAVRRIEKSGAERSSKVKTHEAGSLLDGAVTELRATKRRRLSSDDSCGSSPPKSLLGHSQETTSNNYSDDDLDEFGEDKHFEPGEFVSLSRNTVKHKRKQTDKRLMKSQSINYRISSERRKRLAAILNSDSDCDNVVTNGNDISAETPRSSSVGMVSQYFQRAMQSGSRSTTTEKISDKEEEEAEKVLIEDLFNDCFIDETKSSPVVAIKTEGIDAEITRIK